jgi:hypothetical protein
MKRRLFTRSRKLSLLCGLLLLLDAPRRLLAEPAPGAVAAFNQYSHAVETRLAEQHRAARGFLAVEGDEARLRAGELIVERVSERGVPAGELAGALLHHWRGTAFAAGAKAADFERLMRDFNGYPQHFAPQVLQARVVSSAGDKVQASMRVRQRHVITVVMDTSYDVEFGRLDARHGYSVSESTRVAEIEGAGTAAERVLGPKEEHGFLWRLNSYWSYEERDGGLYLQIEAVSLTRTVPRGLAWVVKPYVESIPRESMEFTLRSASNAVHK